MGILDRKYFAELRLFQFWICHYSTIQLTSRTVSKKLVRLAKLAHYISVLRSEHTASLEHDRAEFMAFNTHLSHLINSNIKPISQLISTSTTTPDPRITASRSTSSNHVFRFISPSLVGVITIHNTIGITNLTDFLLLRSY